jgi:hypothetical protein
MKFHGLQILPDGTFAMTEFKGPPNFKTWDLSYAVLWCGLIFLDTVELGPLEAYRSKIRKYATTYEPSQLWHLLYQADYRMRHERMEHLRRIGQEAKDADPSHPFDPQAPWKWVWAEAVSDDKWWKQELEDPAFFVLAKLKSLGAVVDGDAAVAGSTPAPKRKSEQDTVIPDAAPLAITDRPPKKQKNGPSQAQIAGGKFTHNKRGAEICIGFQDGSCRDSKGGFCSKASHRVHQCNLCLAQHAGNTCSKVVATIKPKGKGKGKR